MNFTFVYVDWIILTFPCGVCLYLGTFWILEVLSELATLFSVTESCCGRFVSQKGGLREGKRQYCMIVLLVKPMLTAAAVSAILLPARFSKVNIMLGKLVQSTPA